MELLRAYGVQTDIYFPLIKAAVANFAVAADYTHSAGDVKVSKNGGAAATATNAPSAITMGNGAMWKLTLTATEMQAALIMVTLIDATTKAVEDQAILISTYGNASAQHPFDLATATQTVTVSSGSVSTLVDAVWDEPLTEPSAVFAWAGSFRNALNWLAALSRNKMTQTDSVGTLRNDSDTATIATSGISDNGTTFIRDEWS